VSHSSLPDARADETSSREKAEAKSMASDTRVKLIVGLGNPGIEYQFTPHNIGFLAVDRLAERHDARIANRQCKAATGRIRIGEHDVLLAKPETFMNLSGMSVAELVEEYELDPAGDLVVVYDELDLPLGSLRIRERGGSAGHNGMASVLGALGTQEIKRVRIGIAPEHARDAAKYVLTPIRKSQYEIYDEVLDRAADAVETILKEGAAAAMNRFNRKPDAGEPGE
jgi:PTH1 family peptidyl-tRNA hydrolase